jgi:hypothetical protein
MTCPTTSGAHAGAKPIERKIRHIPSTVPQPLRFRQPGREGGTPIMKPAPFASRPPWRRCVRAIRRSTNRHPANGKETEAHRCPRDLRKGSGRPDLPAFRHRWETRPTAPVWLPYSPVTVLCLPRCGAFAPQLSNGAARGCVAPDKASTQPFQRRFATLSENNPERDPGRVRFSIRTCHRSKCDNARMLERFPFPVDVKPL